MIFIIDCAIQGLNYLIYHKSAATGTIGFSITKQAKDDIIRQLKISRNAYFRGSCLDQGFGFSGDFSFLPPPPTHGWPNYDAIPEAGASVGWTWPYNAF